MNKNALLNEIKQTEFDNEPIALYNKLSTIIMKHIYKKWESDLNYSGKKAYYLSSEYLMGRMIFNNLINLDILAEVNELLKEKGVDIKILEDTDDLALGNGGLGRLAACFLESASTMGIALNGYGIRYKYGLFKQVFENGFQVELPDDWQKFGDPFSIRRDNLSQEIEFNDYKVTAVPYDMAIIGYDCKRIGLLRLWQAEGCVKGEKISEYLYPDDSTEGGKKLRLRQEYFFSSASMKDVLNSYTKKYGNDFNHFSQENIFQLNDTHPVISILEFIRILTEDYNVCFRKAVAISQESFAYTNHTIMAEALECWDMKMLKEILPNIAEIAIKIDRRAYREYKKTLSTEEIKKVKIIYNKSLNMARLAVYMCKYVNGVAEIHSQIIKNNLFSTFNKLYPEKFQNKTNGITQRRWLKLANPMLSDFINSKIGSSWVTDLTQLSRLNDFADDISVIDKINEIKQNNKIRLKQHILLKENIKINENTIFDVQIKRLHEYKRQLMNALSILYIYNDLKDGTLTDFQPTTYIFGAKSAGSYFRAKAIIKFINEIAKLINNDEEVNKIIKVVFVTNYNVSYAEVLIPATDVSEQISLAGTEASGTGNMKLMLNGAVTLGTYDGANIEIVKYAGKENNYIFGLKEDEVEVVRSSKTTSKEILASKPKIKKVVETLIDGTFNDDNSESFADIYKALVTDNDYYLVLRDLEDYIDTKIKISNDYKNKKEFGKKALKNIANAGFFSSDRTIIQYANEIWSIDKI